MVYSASALGIEPATSMTFTTATDATYHSSNESITEIGIKKIPQSDED